MKHKPGLYLASLLFLTQNVLAGEIDVMTQNQYLGADLTPVLVAANEGDAFAFNAAVINALVQVSENSTVERLHAQADLIAKRQPDVVGLQEVYTFSCDDPFFTGACADPLIAGAFNNHLDLTLAALGGAYTDRATVVNFNETVPFDLYGYGMPAFITVTDRDVILARSDLETTLVDFGCVPPYVSDDGCNYVAAPPPIQTLLGEINLVRGYIGVDATVDGTHYRIVNTHLEVKDPPLPAIIQIGQAQELIGVLALTTPPERSLVVLGDINSNPTEPLPLPYAQFIAFAFTDAWTLRPGDVPGFTCCQPEDLLNQESALYERIDMVFSRELPLKVKKARVLGDKVSSKTLPPGEGLWASDHGAVAARLLFP